ncbi:MAG: DUF502 domain-containing protein [Rhodocyclaceae bacterium]|nr:DUF502 domain-containing protein [Rhodocyclaceae bacterium]
MKHLKKYFITGLLIWVPLVITVWVLSIVVNTLDQSLRLLPEQWRPLAQLGFDIPGLGTILTLLIIVITGLVTANILGQQLVKFWEGVLSRIPVVKSIYYSVKQVSDTLFSGSGDAFRQVLLVHYPHPDAWAIAFQTGVPADEVDDKLDDDYIAVFIPTAPSPVNGFFFFVRKGDTIPLDMSVDEALKYIVSMGVVVPAPISLLGEGSEGSN